MSNAWSPDGEVVTAIRARLLDGDSARDVADEYGVAWKTVERHATGQRGDAEAAIGPLRALNTNGLWVRAEVVGDE